MRLTAVVALAVVGWLMAGSNAYAQVSAPDKEFVMAAARGGLLEVELGKLAMQKAANDAVKKFGERMVVDHGKVNGELARLASDKQITVPQGLDEQQQATVKQLTGMSGAEFDQAYMKLMVEEHQRDIALFEQAAANAGDTDLKSWAARTLPTLREHLKQAREISGIKEEVAKPGL